MAQKVLHKRSRDVDAIPSLEFGEIAVNYSVQDPHLTIKDEQGNLITFSSDNEIANNLVNAIKNKSDVGHTHDDRYYTETEINTKLAGKSDTGHTHTKAQITDFAHTHKKSDITDFEHTHGTVTLTGDATGSANFTNTGASITVTVKDDSHTHDGRYYTETEVDAKIKAVNDTIANRYGFSNVKVGTTTLEADSITDTVEFKAGDNIILSATESADTVTVGVKSGVFAPISHDHDYSEIKNTPTSLKNPNAISFTTGATTVGSYDGSTPATITIPSSTTHLTNDSGWITVADKVNSAKAADSVAWANVSGKVNATTATTGIVKLVQGDLSGVTATTAGQAASSYHTHSQYAPKSHTHGTIKLQGDVTGSASFTNGGATIDATVANNSHTHTSSNISDSISAGSGVTSSATALVQGKAVYGYAAPKSHTHGTVALTGGATGSASFTNEGATIAVTIDPDKHSHDAKYSLLGHKHTSNDVTDSISAGSGVTSGATGLVQGKAVYEYAAPKSHTHGTIKLQGDVTGSASFTNGGATINATVANDSHTHGSTSITGKITAGTGITDGATGLVDGNAVYEYAQPKGNYQAAGDYAAKEHSHTITATANDDDVVVLTGTNGSNAVTYTASHATQGPSTTGNTATTDTTTAQSPTHGGKIELHIPKITVNKYGHVTSLSDQAVSVTLPSDNNTHYTTRIYAGASDTAANAAVSNPYLKVTDDNTYRNQVRFVGGGATSVASNSAGTITITSPAETYTKHEDTSTLNGSYGTTSTNGSHAVKQVTVDALGHVTSIITGTTPDTKYSFSNGDVTLKWGTKSTIATVGGTDITVTMPANPDTNTHYISKNIVGAASTAAANAAATNGNVWLNHTEDGTVKSSHNIKGAGATTVTSDSTGTITISSTDTKYTSLKNPHSLTVQKNGSTIATYDGSAAKTANIIVPTKISDITNDLKSLTVGSKTYNGSDAVTITASDLGLAAALKYCGVTTTPLSDGATTNPITIKNGTSTVSHTATAGCVVFNNAGTEEFVFNGTNWELLGRDANYKVVQAAVSDPTASGSGTTFISSITQDTNGVITATKKNVDFSAYQPKGNYKTTQTAVSSPNASGNATAFIDTITQNTNGVISVTKKNVDFSAYVNQNAFSNVKVGTTTVAADSATDTLTLVAGTNVQITADADSDTVTISASHTHNYAGSSSAGGAATSANKLNTDAGSATKPVYFSNGVPVACAYTLGKSVPSDAVFTDTHHQAKNIVGASSSAKADAAATNGNVWLNLIENNTVRSNTNIKGGGATTVTSDSAGTITITSTDTNTWRPVYNGVDSTSVDSAATANAVKTAYDKAVSAYNLANGKWTAASATTASTGIVKLVQGDMNGKAHADGQAPSLAHTHSQYLTSHQAIYNLTMSAGTFAAVTFDPNAEAKTVYIPTHTSHITNNSGYITSAATVNNANNLGGVAASSYATQTWVNNKNYITSAATVAAANKLATERTLWGQVFNGTANVTGAISSTGNITPSANATYELGTSSNKYKNVNVSNNVNVGGSSISYNATTGCLEIIC